MPDVDAFGIVALLLAIAGGAYLLWARFLRGRTSGPSISSGRGVAARSAPAQRIAPESSAREAAVKGAGASAQRGRSGSGIASPVVETTSEGRSEPSVRGVVPGAQGDVSAEEREKSAVSSASPEGTKRASRPPASGDEPAAIASLPSFSVVDDDEDLELTRVGRLSEPPVQAIVEKIVFDEDADEEPSQESAPLAVYAFATTDPGKRRKHNEDSHLVLSDEALFMVADGMGGHQGGQHASQLAVKVVGEAIQRSSFTTPSLEGMAREASELARAIQMANASILREAKKRRELSGMGTTLSAIRFSADKRRMYIGHVGDSRCYRLRDGVMKLMTTDHTMSDFGVAGPEGAHLSRAIGVWPSVPIDLIMATPKLGDVYLLCSDGLTKMVPDGTIATQLLHEEDSKAAVDRLVFFANSNGGKDNITLVLLRVVEPGWQPPSRDD